MRIIERIYEQCDMHQDPRSVGLPLMDDFMEPIGLIVLYLLVVGYLPRIMEHRKAWDLRWLLVPYNLICVAMSAYLLVMGIVILYREDYGFVCGLQDGKPGSDAVYHVHYFFFMTKIFELFDTIFFILRKKNSQVTFLHVYHHASTPLLMWSGPNQYTNQSTFMPAYVFALLNSFVHTIMYLYYALAAMGPNVRKHLWWKRYITNIQLLQFVCTLLFTIVNMQVCQYELTSCYIVLVGTMPHLVLFINFYYQTYIKQRPSVQNQAATANGSVVQYGSTEEVLMGDRHGQNGLRRRVGNSDL